MSFCTRYSLRDDVFSIFCLFSFCIVYIVVCHLLTWEMHKAGETLLEYNFAGDI